MSGLITVKKWNQFQHYKHRSPPWIRLYRRLLDEPWWRALSDNAARLLIELWLVASEGNGTVPFDTMLILWKTKRTTQDIPALHAGLAELAGVGAITIAGGDASADASMVASTIASADASALASTSASAVASAVASIDASDRVQSTEYRVQNREQIQRTEGVGKSHPGNASRSGAAESVGAIVSRLAPRLSA